MGKCRKLSVVLLLAFVLLGCGAAGAIAGKVSGAGGGGFIIFMTDPAKRRLVINALNDMPGRIVGFQFSEGGTHGWKIYD